MSVSIGIRRRVLATTIIVTSLAVGCKRAPSSETPSAGRDPLPRSVPTGSATTTAEDSAVTEAGAPAGPRADVPGEHCALTASLTGPTGADHVGPGTLEVRLDAKDGFHVNELDEVQLQLEGTQSVVRAELARTDATESTADHVRFVVPVQVTGAGASVRGRLRFSVCASVCVRQRLAFTVALP
jgi:hypothetical protein